MATVADQRKLHILAIEPFYGGARRLMLENINRHSRHQWTVLKLPPRRMERRLEASAQWFSEIISRRAVPDFDILFTSEAINLADLYALQPELGSHPAVVYFHDNQLPHPGRGVPRATDHINLFTALEARELWFNSLSHLRAFTARGHALIHQLSQHFAGNTLDLITAKTAIIHPPVELSILPELEASAEFVRDAESIFVDLRQGDTALLAQGLGILQARNVPFKLVTIGPRGQLPAGLVRTSIPDHDEDLATLAMAKCGVFLSVQTDSLFDPRAMMALASGMKVLLPEAGAYPEIVPAEVQGQVLYQPKPDFLASALQDLDLPGLKALHPTALGHVEARRVVANIDDRLMRIAETGPA